MEQYIQCMMKIIKPLSGKSPTSHLWRFYHMRAVEIAFRYCVEGATGFLLHAINLCFHQLPEMHCSMIKHCMNSVYSQAIDVIMFIPMCRIVGEILTYPI